MSILFIYAIYRITELISPLYTMSIVYLGGRKNMAEVDLNWKHIILHLWGWKDFHLFQMLPACCVCACGAGKLKAVDGQPVLSY